jgi:tRNA dimethylallyltransferase
MNLRSNGSKMPPKSNSKKVLIIVGPTAVGKTELSLRLAEQIGGEIISADSRLLYRGMDVGTAKPTREEQERVPHHMVDLAEPDEVWSLSSYQKQVQKAISDIIGREKVPIIVGGTGQYIRSLVEGWTIPPQSPNQELRVKIELWANEIGPAALHGKLAIVDARAAELIDSTNVRRTIRALEVIFLTGKRFSELRSKNESDLDFLIIGLIRPREELYKRVDQRIEAMFRNGLMDEVSLLLKRGYSEEHSPLSAIGYREVVEVLRGNATEFEAKVMMKRKTREFIRRQTNWFKPDDPLIHWYMMEQDPLEFILVKVREWLAKSK